MPLAACTIVSANYLAFARVLARSFHARHPSGTMFVLLVDRNDGRIDPAEEPFELIEVEDLPNLPDPRAFLFKYTLLECNTAVKPFLLAHLFARGDVDRLIYFDPDIWILGDLEPIERALDRHAIVLTPHLTTPIDDGAHPDELAVLQAGAYNLGFIALRDSDVVHAMLEWWQARLFDRCVVRVEDGLFVDQKWMDLVPGLFSDVEILTHRGLNVAYWNLHDRPVTLGPNGEETGARAGDDPLVFFHFSGVDPEHPAPVSKHQDRYTLHSVGDAAVLFERYAEAVLTEGFREGRHLPYAYASFDDGTPIPAIARRLYLDMSTKRRRFGDPFGTGEGSYFAWLNQPHRPGARSPYVSRLLHHLYRSRADLLRIFPEVDGRDLVDFCSWIEGFGRHELKLGDAFLRDIHRDSRATLLTFGGLVRRARNRLKRLYHSAPARAARQLAKRTLGHHRSRALRAKLQSQTTSEPNPGRYRLPMPRTLDGSGINLVGYLAAETGMGQAARALVRAFETTRIPVSLHNLDLNVLARRDDTAFAQATSDFRHDVNLFVVNADQVTAVHEHLGGEVFGGRYNVGLWLWELDRFPDRWPGAFDLLHEIWTPSTFCADAISELSPIPVRRVPLPVALEAPGKGVTFDRAHFGLPEGDFLVLYTFNFLSYAARKNPHGAIDAFRRAFGDDDDDAMLVLKVSQGDFDPEARARLDAAIRDLRVTVIDRYTSRAETDALTAACDTYLSLHRAEGFGLTVAEAMAAGKPVVATPYGGVTDFFGTRNGFPVHYELVTLDDDQGPYPRGSRWAEPDPEDAARCLRQIYDDREHADEIGRRASRDVAELLGHAAVGEVLTRRFDRLLREVARQQLGRLR